MPRRIVVGASGASGTPLLAACLQALRDADDVETHLIMTHAARLTAQVELPEQAAALEELADYCYDEDMIGAKPASGSFRTDGMLVVPCSMKTVAGIANGFAENLLLRAADVTLKEQRPLVLAARETPLSGIHLQNLHALSLIPGVHVIPPMMAFYHRPRTIDDMVNHLTAKLLAPFGVCTGKGTSWEGIDDGR